MSERRKKGAARAEGRPDPAQAEGADEEAGEGLEQDPRTPTGEAAEEACQEGCKRDKGGIVH